MLVDDLGSGALLDTAQFGLLHEPTVAESMAAGADLVAFSGDKLTGGPQAGIIVGRAEPLDALKRHPLARALRADKLCLAGLAATLDLWQRGAALTQIPIWRMIAREAEELHAVAAAWAQRLGGSVVAGESAVGGGSLPGATLPTWLLALEVTQPDEFLAQLRARSRRSSRASPMPRPAGPAHGAAGRGGSLARRAGSCSPARVLTLVGVFRARAARSGSALPFTVWPPPVIRENLRQRTSARQTSRSCPGRLWKIN